MIDPNLFSNIPFRNKTAWKDFTGTLLLYWQQGLAPAIYALTGTAIRLFPIGDGGGAQWSQAVQSQYEEGCQALGITAPPDLASYDLSKEEEFQSFTFLISQTTQRLRIAAGLS